MTLDPLPPLRDVINAHGLTADKRFGQHYLLDLNLTAKIARLCGDIEESTVFEVGPGPGGLTRALLDQGAGEVIAIEKDRRFKPALDAINTASGGRLRTVEADGLAIDETRLETTFQSRLLASNLPYNVGTALLIKWLNAQPIWWERLVLMFQKEVAERVTARPGDKAYGRLAILTCAVAEADYAFTVPARAFTPPPKVDSAVVVLKPLPADQRFADLEALSTVTESAFGQRRKTLRKSLGGAATRCGASSEALLDAAGLDPGARAETIESGGLLRARPGLAQRPGSGRLTFTGDEAAHFLARTALHRVQRTAPEDCPVLDHGHIVSNGAHGGHVVSDRDGRCAQMLHLAADQLVDDVGGHWIKTGGRLIEKQDLRPRGDGAGERGALEHAA